MHEIFIGRVFSGLGKQWLSISSCAWLGGKILSELTDVGRSLRIGIPIAGPLEIGWCLAGKLLSCKLKIERH